MSHFAIFFISHQIVRGLLSTLTCRSFRTTLIHYLFPILSIGDNLPALNSSCKSLSISVQLTGLDSQDTLQHHSQIAALLVDLGKRYVMQRRSNEEYRNL